MAKADDPINRWASLSEALTLTAKPYGPAVAKGKLWARLRGGELPWTAEKLGTGPLEVGDCRVWSSSAEFTAIPAWEENRVTHRTAAKRAVWRFGERRPDPTPKKYHFVAIRVWLPRLVELLPGDMAPPRDEGESGRPSPRLEDAKRLLQAAYPEYEPTSIPKTISSGAAHRQVNKDRGPKVPLISLSTIKRAMGRENN